MENFNNNNNSNVYKVFDWNEEEANLLKDMDKLKEITNNVTSKRVPDIKVDSDPANEKINSFNKAINQYRHDELVDMNRLTEERRIEEYTNKVKQVNSYVESNMLKSEFVIPNDGEE